MPSKYAKFQILDPFQTPFPNKITTFSYGTGTSITHTNYHFAKNCALKLDIKFKKIKFWNLAFVVPFWLSLSPKEK